jgi:hypothetical protein
MKRDQEDERAVLARAIERGARRVVEGELPPAWAGHQLVALVRYWGYGGRDWPMPEAFGQFDLVMTDLECFPDGRMTNDEHIVEAAQAVLDAVSEP